MVRIHQGALNKSQSGKGFSGFLGSPFFLPRKWTSPICPLFVHFRRYVSSGTVNPHPGQVIFAVLILVILAMRLPYVSNNRLLLSQVLSVFILDTLVTLFYIIALATRTPLRQREYLWRYKSPDNNSLIRQGSMARNVSTSSPILPG